MGATQENEEERKNGRRKQVGLGAHARKSPEVFVFILDLTVRRRGGIVRTPTDEDGRKTIITKVEVMIVALKEDKVELPHSRMERFPKFVGLISHIHQRKSPSKKFGKGRP